MTDHDGVEQVITMAWRAHSVLVELVEYPQLGRGKFAPKDAFAVFGDIPIQVRPAASTAARWISAQALAG